MTDTPGHVDGESRAVGAAARDTFPALEDFDVPAIDAPMATAAAQGLEALYDVPVRVLAVLGRSRIPIGELLQLKVGAVLELDRRVGEPVDIFVNNRLIARGEVVLIESSLGVTLTEIVRVNQ